MATNFLEFCVAGGKIITQKNILQKNNFLKNDDLGIYKKRKIVLSKFHVINNMQIKKPQNIFEIAEQVRKFKPERIFRCGLCIDETGNIDQAIYSWKELLQHKHGKKYYWEIEHASI